MVGAKGAGGGEAVGGWFWIGMAEDLVGGEVTEDLGCRIFGWDWNGREDI